MNVPTCAVPIAVSIFAITPEPVVVDTVFPTTRLAVVSIDISCLSMSNSVTVPVCDVKLVFELNVPVISFNTA